MSIKRMADVWDNSKQSGAGLLIMLAIADACNDDGYGWPGMTRLARMSRVGRRHVIELIKDCKRTGELAVVHRTAKKAKITNLYVLLIGLKGKEKKARIQLAMQSVAGVVFHRTLPSESQITRGSDPATAHKPFVIPSIPSIHPAVALWEKVVGTPVTGIKDLEYLKCVFEELPADRLIKSMQICVEREVRKVSYLRGVITGEDKPKGGNGSKPTAAREDDPRRFKEFTLD